MIANRMFISLVALTVGLMILIACGASAEPAAPAPAAMSESAGLPGNPGNLGIAAARAADAPPPAPAFPPAPAPTAAAALPVEFAVVSDKESAQVGEFSKEQAALVAQNRIIVRTANMSLEVQNVAHAIDAISATSQQLGGWIVSSDRSSTHTGFIAVRVPSEQLDQAVRSIRGLSVSVLSEASTSEDVTDQYYDLRARLDGLEATRARLLEILDGAYKVEDALSVHQEMLEIQLQIEAHQGRIKLLEQTAAFSLLNISLNLAPANMQVNGGGDRIIGVGEPDTFRATFYPPAGLDYYESVWDFGDGTTVVRGMGSVPTADGGRITATVNHTYQNDIDSPYIVEVTVTGTGDAGIAKGTDTFLADVSHIPEISVFPNLNDDVTRVEEGKEIVYSATFTRDEDLSNYEFEWDFGDGSPVTIGTPADGVTKVEASHVFTNHRPFPFTVTLTVTADSTVGRKVTGVNSFDVYVREDAGFVMGGWSAVDTSKVAIRALSALAQAAGTVLIWLAIFSPVWLIAGIVIYLFVRFRRRLIDTSRRSPAIRNDASDNADTQEGQPDAGIDDNFLSTATDGNEEEQT